MLKKLSLLFIKISSSLLALDLLIKLIILYIPINLIWINFADIIIKMILCIGFLIVSFTFKYCGYHRSLLYILLISYCFYIIFLFIDISIITMGIFMLFVMVTLITTFIIIYSYEKYKRNNNRK